MRDKGLQQVQLIDHVRCPRCDEVCETVSTVTHCECLQAGQERQNVIKDATGEIDTDDEQKI
ncbi:hypothetical protein GCM10007242_23800 [Pigmentiphaga litoralis]|nr:hypothetical protein GCM10007242_23800 [Pigmentiphaga litoralis]